MWRLDDVQYGKTVATLFKGRSTNTNDDLTAPAGLALPLAATAAGGAKFSTSSSVRRVAPTSMGWVADMLRGLGPLATRQLADVYTTLAQVLGAPVEKFNGKGTGRIDELLA